MLRSRMYTAFPLLALFVLLATGCGQINSKNFRNNDAWPVEKPTDQDYSGDPANLEGLWTGPCKFIEAGDKNDCDATMQFHQVSMLAGQASFSFDFKYGALNRQMANFIQSDFFTINKNSMNLGSQTVGKFGSKALNVSEKVFQNLIIRVLDSRQIQVMAVRLPSMNFMFDFDGTTSACPSRYCFVATLKKQ